MFTALSQLLVPLDDTVRTLQSIRLHAETLLSPALGKLVEKLRRAITVWPLIFALFRRKRDALEEKAGPD